MERLIIHSSFIFRITRWPLPCYCTSMCFTSDYTLVSNSDFYASKHITCKLISYSLFEISLKTKIESLQRISTTIVISPLYFRYESGDTRLSSKILINEICVLTFLVLVESVRLVLGQKHQLVRNCCELLEVFTTP